MKKLLFTLLGVLGFFCVQTNAQMSTGGTPVSFLYPELSMTPLDAIRMPAVDVNQLMAEDQVNDRDWTKPHRFGFPMEVLINTDNAGKWDYLANGDKIWRVSIRSAGAQTINLIFSKYKLPAGAQLFIYNKDKSSLIGAFTALNNQEDEKLGTTLVAGDEMTIDYYEPSWADFNGKLEIGTVVHGYRLPGSGEEERTFGASGSCNNNVNCPSGAPWVDQKRSVAKIVNGGDWCTGALINNTSNNGTPLFLTANHCYASTYSTWVFWFNYEGSGCSNPGTNPTYQSLSGSALKARNAPSDFLLLQLNTTPPSSYNVYYAGWDRSGNTPTTETGIHHPSGDIKKISFDTDPATNSNWSGTPANSHWHVIWNSGVTEGGSSGSPLFDQNKRIIGQLHGGASACGGSDLSDEYGKLSWSWDYGTTSSTRLKDWLDPTTTNAITLDGYNPTGSSYLTVTPSNYNATAAAGSTSFGVSANVTWTATSGASWLTITPTSGSGNGSINATFSANTGSATRVGTITVSGGGMTQSVTVTQQGTVTCSNDNEPANNATSTAPVIALNTDKYSQIGTTTDKDYWKFTLAASTTVTLTLTNLPADFDLKLLKSNGTTIATSQNAGTTSESITQTLAAGTYYAYVYGYNSAYSTTQCYDLKVNTAIPYQGNQNGSTDKYNTNKPVTIAPNPTTGFAVITLPNNEVSTVYVFDQVGKLVTTLKGTEQVNMDLSAYPNGVYFIRVNNGGYVSKHKLIVAH